mgnify:CR=1 FL=1
MSEEWVVRVLQAGTSARTATRMMLRLLMLATTASTAALKVTVCGGSGFVGSRVWCVSAWSSAFCVPASLRPNHFFLAHG